MSLVACKSNLPKCDGCVLPACGDGSSRLNERKYFDGKVVYRDTTTEIETVKKAGTVKSDQEERGLAE